MGEYICNNIISYKRFILCYKLYVQEQRASEISVTEVVK